MSVDANHGGGYAYRLCPKSENITEECFQRHHLEFVLDYQWVQKGANRTSRVAVPATRVSEGTHPPASQWTRFGMPSCSGYYGGVAAGGSDVPGRVQALCNYTQFPPALPWLYGQGLTQCLWPALLVPEPHNVIDPKISPKPIGGLPCTAQEIEQVKELFNLNFVDLVRVPPDLPLGEYVLSYRHDCEQVPQVYTACADIIVTPPGVPLPPSSSPTPSPTP